MTSRFTKLFYCERPNFNEEYNRRADFNRLRAGSDLIDANVRVYKTLDGA